MSIFRHLTERIWDGYLALKKYHEEFPERSGNALKKAGRTKEHFLAETGKVSDQLKELSGNIQEKRKLIDEELVNLTKNSKNIAVLKEKLELLSQHLKDTALPITTGIPIDQQIPGVLSEWEKRIHTTNDLLAECHNLMAVVKRTSRLLRSEDRKLKR